MPTAVQRPSEVPSIGRGDFVIPSLPFLPNSTKKVADGTEAKIVLEKNSQLDYREKLNAELAEMANMEMWRAGAKVRELRPENWKREA